MARAGQSFPADRIRSKQPSMRSQAHSALKTWLALGLVFSLSLPGIDLQARGGHRRESSIPHTYRSHTYSSHRSSLALARDGQGRIKRSSSARREFKLLTGYPHGRKGYVIDHVIPLACGGPDDPSNMQWQTIEEAKAKDKWERKGC
jgi:hypothetical protein